MEEDCTKIDSDMLTSIEAHGVNVPRESQEKVLAKLLKKSRWRYKDAYQEMTAALNSKSVPFGIDPMIIGRKAADDLMNHLCRVKAAKIKKGRFVWTREH